MRRAPLLILILCAALGAWFAAWSEAGADASDPRPELRAAVARGQRGLVRVRLVRGEPRGDAVRRRLFRSVRDRRAGTGILVGPRRVLVHSALSAYDAAEFELTDETGAATRARLIEEAPEVELALLEAEADLAGLPLEWRRTHGLRTGELSIALGDPFGLARGGDLSASLGLVEGRARLDARESPFAGEVLLTSAALNPGSEGGALIDLDARLLGLIAPLVQDRRLESPRGGGPEGLTSYAIPAEACQRALLTWDRPRLGFQAREREGVVRIERVEAEGPAARAGLEPGDLILSVEGRQVQSTTQLRLALVGDGPFRLSISRAGGERVVELAP